MPTVDSLRRAGQCGRERFLSVTPALALAALVSGCTTLGPDYERPEPTVEQKWSLLEASAQFKPDAPVDDGRWWKVFDDPVLDRLIDRAYQQNLTLKTAGVRILEARAQLGIAVGSLYPQVQQATGDIGYVSGSRNVANSRGSDLNFWNADVGLSAGWELDFWGRFARGIESSDASLLASVAQYDDILVSLTGQIATTYTTLRTLEERIDIANQNTEIQRHGLKISTVRFENGGTTELDVTQAQTLLSGTQASVVGLESSRRQALNALATLLGVTPQQVYDVYGPQAGEGAIPNAPAGVAVGIPADLLRRRPDVRLAELQARAQSALIGVAEADLYPSISLVGSIGLSAGDGTRTSRNGSVNFGDIIDGDALRFSGGPSVTWNIFNYGRIKNNVRVQDARLQQLLVNYQNTVLSAGQEVEDAMDGFLASQETTGYLETGVTAAKRAVELALIQYQDGATDYTTVLDTQRQLTAQQDSLTQARGSIAQNLVAMYRALGGGWRIREGNDFVPEDIREVMRERTDWGGLLDPQAVQNLPSPDEARETLRSPDW